MWAAILLMAEAQGDWIRQTVVVTCLLAILLITIFALLAAAPIQNLLCITGLHMISRIFGVLLSALAVQFMFDGVRESGQMAMIK